MDLSSTMFDDPAAAVLFFFFFLGAQEPPPALGAGAEGQPLVAHAQDQGVLQSAGQHEPVGGRGHAAQSRRHRPHAAQHPHARLQERLAHLRQKVCRRLLQLHRVSCLFHLLFFLSILVH